MSTVGLPLVPSARSSNSSSSSRSNLHSAGSINSEKSAQSVRSQRSLYQQEDEDTEELEEEPQESSGGLWDEVEHFLNKPSPSLSTLSVKPSTATKPQSTLPRLNGRRASPDNQATKPRPPASSGPKAIDPKLLQEAFAYANQLQQVDFDEDEDQQSWRHNKTKMLMQRAALGRTNSSSSVSSSGPNGRASGAKDARKKKTKSTSSAYSAEVKPKAVRKKRSTFDGTPDTGSQSKSRGHMDPQTLQALVSNFQNGTALDELRRELAASQQSMAMSRQVLQDAAQNFFQSH
ncbi:hypothetical protein F444_10434 [Phytophthora nicotianae P1976]|uniref:Uncharacterized protein n=1 Tax=Phytophthora nicotianae P1976 TaxID=1317066 RepID=A0A081A455_PHYNI|nr:hypothetical protein F444_10434 [Phytophthora nicotianae P1976]